MFKEGSAIIGGDQGANMASACVLIEGSSGGVMVVARRNDPDSFGLPGGKIEKGETERQAAARECAEETGWVFDPNDLEEVFRRDGGVTYRAELRDAMLYDGPKDGEPDCKWGTWEELFAGPFGEYNRKLFAALGRSHIGGC